MDRVIHLTADLRCQPAEAFEHFVSKPLLESWLTTVAEVEAVVGGRYELFWDPADRENDSTIGCRITALEPGAVLAFEWKSPRQYKHFAGSSDPLTHVVVAFSPTADGTRVHLIHSGWRSTPEWQEAADWQERAWTLALGELEAKVNGGPTMSSSIPVGAVVRVQGIPDLGSMPSETQAAFKAALGRELRVVGHGRYGHLELELGPDLDAELGGFMNSIWIEPELVEVVG